MDVVLGVQWLGSLGPMEFNWKCLTMKFQMGDMVIVLKGGLRLNKTEVSLKAMVKVLQDEGQGIWVESVPTAKEEKEKEKEIARNIK